MALEIVRANRAITQQGVSRVRDVELICLLRAAAVASPSINRLEAYICIQTFWVTVKTAGL